MNNANVNIKIEGRVRNVLFNALARIKAARLGVKRFDVLSSKDRVEIFAEGRKEKLWEIVTWVKKGTAFFKVKDTVFKFTEVNKKN